MKKYMKNKNFIPEKFYYKNELNNSKMENRIMILFLLMNLLLLPTTYKEMNKANEKPHIINNNIKQNQYYLENIIMWVDNIFNDNIERAYITNNDGEILVDNLDRIDKLNLSNSLKIKDISKNDDEKYKLGLSLNE